MSADGRMAAVKHLPTLAFDRRHPIGKRVFDVAGAVILGIVLLPLLALLAVLIAATSPGPVMHRHERFGAGGTRFSIYKFRTMVTDADELLTSDPSLWAELEAAGKLRQDPRITPIGRLLRLLSLDELPQLLNVLRGEMSLVGPRPLRHPFELDWYGDEVSELLSVRPGMTGLWQVSGRNNLPPDDRVALDLAYVRRMSPILDLVILVRTLRVVLFPRGNGAY